MLRIRFETQGNRKFDSKEVENAPSSWLRQAWQHEDKEDKVGENWILTFLVEWWPLCCYGSVEMQYIWQKISPQKWETELHGVEKPL